MRTCKINPASWLLFLCMTAALAAQPGVCSWTIYRGTPGLTGVTQESIPGQPELLWSFSGTDAFKSSPVISDNRIFIGSADGLLYALRFPDGKKLWEFASGNGIEASPLAAFNTLFVGNIDGQFHALDPATGKLLWKYKTGNQIAGSANAFTLNSGKTKRVVVGSYDTKIHCIDAATGRGIWVYTAENYINGTPAVYNDNIVFGGCDAMLRVLEAKSGKEKLRIDVNAYIPGSAAVDGNRAYTGHYGNQVVCLDLVKGNIIWKYGDEEQGAAFFSSPAVTADQVIIGDRDGKLHCIDKKLGTGLWVFATGSSIDCSPVVAADKVIFGADDGFLYILNLADGKKTWSYELGGNISGSPAVTCGTIIVGADDNRVYAFGKKGN